MLQLIVLPTGFAALLAALGIAALVTARTRRIAWVPFCASGLVVLVFSNGLVATMLMSPLEYAYPAMHDPASHPGADAIVVLTAYAADDASMPLSSRLNSSSAFRVLEAANLHARRPDCRVIVTGSQPAAALMASQLVQLGVPAGKVTIDGDSPDTADSAAFVSNRALGRPVFLVTSAGHMPRALGLFRHAGVRSIPAPTDYWLPRDVRDASWSPSSLHLQASDLAVHEYLALAWYRLSGML